MLLTWKPDAYPSQSLKHVGMSSSSSFSYLIHEVEVCLVGLRLRVAHGPRLRRGADARLAHLQELITNFTYQLMHRRRLLAVAFNPHSENRAQVGTNLCTVLRSLRENLLLLYLYSGPSLKVKLFNISFFYYGKYFFHQSFNNWSACIGICEVTRDAETPACVDIFKLVWSPIHPFLSLCATKH